MDSAADGAASGGAAAQQHTENNSTLPGSMATASASASASATGKKKKQNNDPPSYVINKDPRYLPDLKGLTFAKGHIDMNGIVIRTLSPQEHRHDAEAAQKSQDEHCPVFEIPRQLFPRNAPLNKITYLPPQLLPKDFEAGGVFPAGVLAHKFYPNGMLQPRHRGPTPPLFVGCRRKPEKKAPARQKVQHTCATLMGIPLSQMSPPTTEPGFRSDQLHPEMSIGYLIAHADSLSKVQRFARKQTQYHIYVPDLSAVPLMVYSMTPLCVTVLSDVIHPHEAEVALAALREETPTFELPSEYFSIKSGFIKREPIFLPSRYLPPGFDAGCVFGPGTLPPALFQHLLSEIPPQLQRNLSIMPPLFIGQWKGRSPPAMYVFPKQINLKDMIMPKPAEKPGDEIRVAREELKSLPKLHELQEHLQKQGQCNQHNKQPAVEEKAGKEKVDEKPVDEKAVDEKPVVKKPVVKKPVVKKPVGKEPSDGESSGAGAVDEDPVDEKPLGKKPADGKPTAMQPKNIVPSDEEPIGEESEEFNEEYLEEPFEDLEECEYEYDYIYDYIDDDEYEIEDNDEDEVAQSQKETDEENYSTTTYVNSEIDQETTPSEDSDSTNTVSYGLKSWGGIWFFTLSGLKKDLDETVEELTDHGVKLASQTFDQLTLRRAKYQWIDLQVNYEKRRANMVAHRLEEPPRIRRPRRKPKPVTPIPSSSPVPSLDLSTD